MCCCIWHAGNNCAIVSRYGYICIWSEAQDQESTNHSAQFVKWKLTIVINLRFSKDDPFSIKKKEQKKSLPSNNPNQINVEKKKILGIISDKKIFPCQQTPTYKLTNDGIVSPKFQNFPPW